MCRGNSWLLSHVESQEGIRALRAGRGELWTRLESRRDEPDQYSGYDASAVSRPSATRPGRAQRMIHISSQDSILVTIINKIYRI